MAEKSKYRANLKIDKKNIDNEILRQPQLYYEWALLASEAEVERDDAKEKYDIWLIEIEARIRMDPDKYFGEDVNPTEGAIKSKLNNHPKIKRLRRKYHKRVKEYKLLLKAEKAFEQRKRMLELYLYHIHRMMEGDVRVPRRYEQKIHQRTKKSIEKGLSSIKKR